MREVLCSASTSAASSSASKWGETEYGIGILPLGGYVKMLGQDDNPAHIAEQLQEIAKSPRGSPDAVEVHRPQRRDATSSTAAATWPRACRSGWRSSRPA